MGIIIEQINEIFRKASKWQNKDGAKIRHRKISIQDVIKYKFLYSQINNYIDYFKLPRNDDGTESQMKLT